MISLEPLACSNLISAAFESGPEGVYTAVWTKLSESDIEYLKGVHAVKMFKVVAIPAGRHQRDRHVPGSWEEEAEPRSVGPRN